MNLLHRLCIWPPQVAGSSVCVGPGDEVSPLSGGKIEPTAITPVEELPDARVGRFEMPSRAYLGRFNFKGADQPKIVGSCPAASAAGCTSRRRC